MIFDLSKSLVFDIFSFSYKSWAIQSSTMILDKKYLQCLCLAFDFFFFLTTPNYILLSQETVQLDLGTYFPFVTPY